MTAGIHVYLSEVVNAMVGMGNDPIRSRRIVAVKIWMRIFVE
jgi:hypothetical protein